MKIWQQEFTLEGLQNSAPNTMMEALGIVFTEFGDDFLAATMPVSPATVQPMRILHGGASVALAETVGSVASLLCLPNMDSHYVVGLDINANHVRSASEGDTVTAICRPYHVGRTTHVWNIEIRDSRQRLVCISRLTMAVVSNK
jgi:1,4-dihydroxy-2-naphthoyl-CoA hydrolase